MIHVVIETDTDGIIFGRSTQDSIAKVLSRAVDSDSNFVIVTNPARAVQQTAPITNDQDQVKLKDGSWVAILDVKTGKVPPTKVAMQIVGTNVIAYGSDTLAVRLNSVLSVRTLSSGERKAYTDAITEASSELVAATGSGILT